ncbi:MAG: MFS transporter [Hyphomonadaceae bacterium]|nr:MFS transporter [Hyphomonadaceae bacterium]
MSSIRKVGLATKTAYGLGQMAEGVVTIVFLIFLLFYYNQVLGLSGTATGLALFLALLVDAITDPLMGALSDRTRSRWGRRHPYLYAAILPLPIAFVLLFSPPDGLGDVGLFAWLVFFAVLVRLGLTVFFVPHLALGAELSADYHERNQIVAFRQFFSMCGYLVALIVGFGVFFVSSEAYPNGQMNPGAYPAFAMIMAGVIAASMLVSALGTHSQVGKLPSRAGNLAQSYSLRADLMAIFANRSFRFLVLGMLLFYIVFGVRGSLSLHVFTYYWELGSGAIQTITTSTILGLIVGVVIWAVAGRFFEKRTGFILGFMGWVGFTAWPVLQDLLGLYPGTASAAYVGVIVWTSIAASIMGAATNVFAGSMIADCIDENELDTGQRQEGAFFGAFTIASKSTTGLGTWLAGLALDIIDFPANAEPGQVDEATLVKLGLMAGPLLIVGGLAALFFIRRYALTRERYQEIQSALKRVRAERGV